MKACHANFSPIFSLFSDPGGVMARLRAAAGGTEPDMDVVDHKGIPHRLWRVTDADALDFVQASLADQRLFIADGHHRYETALSYRDWVARREPSFDGNHPANFVMMYLCAMEDPGMLIRPAHRLLLEISDESMDRLMAGSAEAFDITPYPFTAENREAVQKEFVASLGRQSGQKTVLGVCLRGRESFYRMDLRPGVMAARFGHEIPQALLDLDVTVLTRLVFMDILGFDQARLDDATRIDYSSLTGEALDAVDRGGADVAFILNPTRMEQVRRVSSQGLIMPRKSTYFYPKVLSGRVLNTLVP